MKILIVKLSSLGDVLHNLPIIWDIRKTYPEAQLDWLVEEAYVELLEPLLSSDSFKGIDHIIPMGLRRIRRAWKKQGLIKSFKELNYQKQTLQATTYDMVIETQGLLKAAMMTAIAKKSRTAVVAGIGNQTEDSGYEPLSRIFYNKSVQVPFHYHAIDRSRAVAAGAMSIPILDRNKNPPQFYPDNYVANLQEKDNPLGLAKGSYVMCFHATARLAKGWQVHNWIALGQFLASKGLSVLFPWGNVKEKLISDELAKDVSGAIVPAAFSIQEAFVINSQAKLVIGVDTGLTHLAAVLGVPTIEIYVDSPKWKTGGYWSDKVINLGDKQQAPTLEEAISAASKLII